MPTASMSLSATGVEKRVIVSTVVRLPATTTAGQDAAPTQGFLVATALDIVVTQHVGRELCRFLVVAEAALEQVDTVFHEDDRDVIRRHPQTIAGDVAPPPNPFTVLAGFGCGF